MHLMPPLHDLINQLPKESTAESNSSSSGGNDVHVMMITHFTH
jgi:hypothetical protein